MAENIDDIKKLHDALSKKGYSSYDIGTEEQFRKAMKDKNIRKQLFDYINDRGDFRIGSYDKYEKRITDAYEAEAKAQRDAEEQARALQAQQEAQAQAQQQTAQASQQSAQSVHAGGQSQGQPLQVAQVQGQDAGQEQSAQSSQGQAQGAPVAQVNNDALRGYGADALTVLDDIPSRRAYAPTYTIGVPPERITVSAPAQAQQAQQQVAQARQAQQVSQPATHAQGVQTGNATAQSDTLTTQAAKQDTQQPQQQPWWQGLSPWNQGKAQEDGQAQQQGAQDGQQPTNQWDALMQTDPTVQFFRERDQELDGYNPIVAPYKPKEKADRITYIRNVNRAADSAWNESVKDIVDQAIKEGDDAAKRAISNEARGKRPFGVAPGYDLARGSMLSRDVAKATDAADIIAKTKKYVDDKYKDEQRQAGGGDGKGEMEMTPQMSAVRDALMNKVYNYLVERKVPKSSAEYIMRKAFSGSTIGLFSRLSDGQSTTSRQIEQQGLSQYNANWMENLAGEAGGMALDLPLMAVTGGVGSLGGQVAMKGVTRSAVKKMVAQGVEKEVAQGIATRAAQQTALRYGVRAASEAVNFATLEGVGSAVQQQYNEGKISPWQVVQDAAKGGLTGAVMGVFGAANDSATRGMQSIFGEGRGKVAGYVTSLGGRTTILAGSSVLGQALNNPDFDINDVNWTDEFVHAGLTNLGFDILGAVKKYSDRKRIAAFDPAKLNLTKDEIEQLNRAGLEGKNAMEIAKNMFESRYAEMTGDESGVTDVAKRNAVDLLGGDAEIPQDAKTTRLMDVLNSADVDLQTKSKLAYLATGNVFKTAPSTSVSEVQKNEDGTYRVDLNSATGQLNETRNFKTEKEAEKYRTDHINDTKKNQVSALEEMMQTAGRAISLNETVSQIADYLGVAREEVVRIINNPPQALSEEELSRMDPEMRRAYEDGWNTYQMVKWQLEQPGTALRYDVENLQRGVAEEYGEDAAWMKKALNSKYRDLDEKQQSAVERYVAEMQRLLSGEGEEKNRDRIDVQSPSEGAQAEQQPAGEGVPPSGGVPPSEEGPKAGEGAQRGAADVQGNSENGGNISQNGENITFGAKNITGMPPKITPNVKMSTAERRKYSENRGTTAYQNGDRKSMYHNVSDIESAEELLKEELGFSDDELRNLYAASDEQRGNILAQLSPAERALMEAYFDALNERDGVVGAHEAQYKELHDNTDKAIDEMSAATDGGDVLVVPLGNKATDKEQFGVVVSGANQGMVELGDDVMVVPITNSADGRPDFRTFDSSNAMMVKVEGVTPMNKFDIADQMNQAASDAYMTTIRYPFSEGEHLTVSLSSDPGDRMNITVTGVEGETVYYTIDGARRKGEERTNIYRMQEFLDNAVKQDKKGALKATMQQADAEAKEAERRRLEEEQQAAIKAQEQAKKELEAAKAEAEAQRKKQEAENAYYHGYDEATGLWGRKLSDEDLQEKVVKLQERGEELNDQERGMLDGLLKEQKRRIDKAAEEAQAEADRLKKEALEGIPEWHLDKPEHARARGARRYQGEMYMRQKPIADVVVGKEVGVKFGNDDVPTGRVSVIDVSQLQPSHLQGRRNPMFFIDEAQPKDRSEAVSTNAAQKIAEGINPEEITGSVTAYTGAPTVNSRGEVIQGNSRSDALHYLWENALPEQQSKYKQYLIDHAEQFGLDAEAVKAMEKPVLVNMLDVKDEDAIRLGQMTASDTESGGTERLKPKNVAQKLGEDNMRIFANMLLATGDDEATYGQLVDKNGKDAIRWMNRIGVITDTQYKSAFDSKGNLTAEAKNDLQKVLNQAVLKGGGEQLEEMFEKLPAKAQRAILSTAYRDLDSPAEGKMLEEVQASVMAYEELSKQDSFSNAKNMEQVLRAIDEFKRTYKLDDRFVQVRPADNFSNFALYLAGMYKASDMSQTTIAACFNDMYDLAQGKVAATLFSEADTTKYTLGEVVKKVLGFDYEPAKNRIENDTNGSNDVDLSDHGGEEGKSGVNEPPASGEQAEGGTEPTERGAGTSTNSGQGTQVADGFKPIGKGFFGNIYDQFKGKAKEAFAFLTKNKSGDLLSVFHRNEVGDIDLVWGDEDGGLYHIIYKHVGEGKDFADVDEARSVIEGVINNGSVVKDRWDKMTLEKDGMRVVIRKNIRNKETGDIVDENKNWVVTSFDNKIPKSKKGTATLATAGQTDESDGSRAVEPNPSDYKGNTLSSEKQAESEKSSTQGTQSEIDAASADVNVNPTEGQKEAGNYKMGHVKVAGFNITIENPAGSVRKGVDEGGKAWETTMNNAYGYFKGTEGPDGDHIDVFLHTNMDEWDVKKVYVVDQTKPDGTFDEHKVMFGFNDKDAALQAYLANYDANWAETHPGLRISEVSLDEFKKWVDSSHRKTKPFADYASVKKTDDWKLDDEEEEDLTKMSYDELVSEYEFISEIPDFSTDSDDYITEIERRDAEAGRVPYSQRKEAAEKEFSDGQHEGIGSVKRFITEGEVDELLRPILEKYYPEAIEKGITSLSISQLRDLKDDLYKKSNDPSSNVDHPEIPHRDSGVLAGIAEYLGDYADAREGVVTDLNSYRLNLNHPEVMYPAKLSAKDESTYIGSWNKLFSMGGTPRSKMSDSGYTIDQIELPYTKESVKGIFDVLYKTMEGSGQAIGRVADGENKPIDSHSVVNYYDPRKKVMYEARINTPFSYKKQKPSIIVTRVSYGSDELTESERSQRNYLLDKNAELGQKVWEQYEKGGKVDSATLDYAMKEAGIKKSTPFSEMSREQMNDLYVTMRDRLNYLNNRPKQVAATIEAGVLRGLMNGMEKMAAEVRARKAEERKMGAYAEERAKYLPEVDGKKVTDENVLNEIWKGYEPKSAIERIMVTNETPEGAIRDLKIEVEADQQRINELKADEKMDKAEKEQSIAKLEKEMKEASDYLEHLKGATGVEDVEIHYRKKGGPDRGEKSLVGVHNITEEKLQKALKLGGLANPSSAVINLNVTAHNKYGEISLVMPSSLVDKKSGRNAGTWASDAYTPRFPSTVKEFGKDGAKRVSEYVKGLPDGMDDYMYNSFMGYVDVGNSPAPLAYLYLHEKGETPKTLRVESKYDAGIIEALKKNNLLDKGVFKMSADELQKLADIYADANYADAKNKAYKDGKTVFDKLKEDGVFDAEELGQVRLDRFMDSVKRSIRTTGEVDYDKTSEEAYDEVKRRGLVDDFYKWVADKEEEFGVKEMLYTGMTPSGTRKYVPLTLENVSKLMKKQGREGSEDFFWNSPGALRARLTKNVNSIAAMQKAKERLVSTEEMQGIAQEISDRFFELKDIFAGGYRDSASVLSEVLTSNDMAGTAKRLGYELSEDELTQLNDYKKILENAPTEYFETKFERPVGIEEFAAAVVPKDADAKVKAALKEKGLTLFEYERGNDEDRKRALDEASASRDDIKFSIRKEAAPKKTGIGYKVFVLGKDGKLYPPMVANPGGEDTPVGVWLNADAAPVVGTSKTGRAKVKAGGKGTQGGSGQLAYRPGWHLGEIPFALQFNRINPETGARELFPNNFVWAEVEYANDVDYQKEAMSYGVNPSGKFQHSLAGLPRVPENGAYRYRTNPNPETDPWVITGAMKVNRIMKPSEVDEMVRRAGREPQQRQEGAVTDEQVEKLNSFFPKYRIGEGESREMTAEERRAQFDQETKDVSDVDKKFLRNAMGESEKGVSLPEASRADDTLADSEEGQKMVDEDIARMHEIAPNAQEAVVVNNASDIVSALSDLGPVQMAQVVQAARNPNVLGMYVPAAKKVVLVAKHGTAKEIRDTNWHENFHYAIDKILPKDKAGRERIERAAKVIDRLDPALAEWVEENYNENEQAEEKIAHALENFISYCEDNGLTKNIRGGLDFGDEEMNALANDIINFLIGKKDGNEGYTGDVGGTSPTNGRENQVGTDAQVVTGMGSAGRARDSQEGGGEASGRGEEGIAGSAEGDPRYRFIGEKGASRLDDAEGKQREATSRMENLRVAREMEEGKKDAKAIKMATGWERGADGKWRYETPDFKVKQESIPGDSDAVYEEYKKLDDEKRRLNSKIERLWNERDRFPERNRTPEQKERIKEIDKQVKKLIKERDKVESEFSQKSYELKASIEGRVSLSYLISDDSGLFDAYPILREFPVYFENLAPNVLGLTSYGRDNVNPLDIRIRKDLNMDQVVSILNHEVQHVIQGYEGFARGGDVNEFNDRRIDVVRDLNFYTSGDLLKGGTVISDSNSLAEALNKNYGMTIPGYEHYRIRDAYSDVLQRVAQKYGYKDLDALVADYENIPSAFEQYHRLGGEVESRNVQSRLGMTPEERRASLASDTEDVPRDKQVIAGGQGDASSIKLSLRKPVRKEGESAAAFLRRQKAYEDKLAAMKRTGEIENEADDKESERDREMNDLTLEMMDHPQPSQREGESDEDFAARKSEWDEWNRTRRPEIETRLAEIRVEAEDEALHDRDREMEEYDRLHRGGAGGAGNGGGNFPPGDVPEGFETSDSEPDGVNRLSDAEMDEMRRSFNEKMGDAKILTTKEQAKKDIRTQVIERRRYIESCNLEDAIFVDDLKKVAGDKQVLKDIPAFIEGTYEGTPSEALKKAAKMVQDWFGECYNLMRAEDVLYDAPQIEDYVTHIWDFGRSPKEAQEKYNNYVNTMRLRNPYTRHRVIPSYAQGIEMGMVPKYEDITGIITEYGHYVSETIANKRMLDFLKTFKIDVPGGKDNMPMSMDLIVKDSVKDPMYSRMNHTALEGVKVLNMLKPAIAPVFGEQRILDHSQMSELATKLTNGIWTTSSLMKKIALSFSFFHHGALTETAVAMMKPWGAAKVIAKNLIWDCITKGNIPAMNDKEAARDAVKHLVSLGATNDYATADVANLTTKLYQWTKDKNIPVAKQAAKLLDFLNTGSDKLLWDVIHDGYKVASYKKMADEIRRLAKAKGWDELTTESALDEAGQLVNDTYGGLHFDILGFSPRSVRIMRALLLSPDWTLATTRQALSVFGFGKLYKDDSFWASLKGGNPAGKMRAKYGRQFWMTAGIFFYGLMNSLNAYFRAKDEDDEKAKAEEMRKVDPTYKSPYELAYPDGMKWYDYTMLGNSLGQQTHLFTGRYSDGTESYARWGKQFREMPELFFGRDGFSFPGPMIDKLAGKANPLLATSFEFISGHSLSGWENKQMKDKKGVEKDVARLYMLGTKFLPYSVPTQEDKDFMWLDLVMPSTKGFTKGKANSYFEKAILSGDMNYVKAVYNACVMNGLNPETHFNVAKAKIEAEAKAEQLAGVEDVGDALKQFDETSDLKERKRLKRYIEQQLGAQDYRAISQAEMVEMAQQVINGEQPEQKNEEKYLMRASSSDLSEDYRMKKAMAGLKSYWTDFNELRKTNPEAAQRMMNEKRKELEGYAITQKCRSSIAHLKSLLGQGKDEEVMENIRKVREEWKKEMDKY